MAIRTMSFFERKYFLSFFIFFKKLFISFVALDFE